VGKVVDELQLRRRILLVITAVVLSYCVTSVSFRLVENQYSVGGRFFHYHSHKLCLEGKGPAPNQYRCVVYPMVEYFFKHVPMRWYDSSFLTVKRWAGVHKGPTAELDNQLNLNAYISEEERERLANDLEKVLVEKLTEVTKTPVASNLLVSLLNRLGWKDWIRDPFGFAKQLVEMLPEDVKQVFDDNSDLSRVINGYATMRFFFTVLTLLCFYQWSKFFVDDFTSYLSVFALAVFLAFSYGDFLQQEFPISLFVFVLSLVLIYKNKPWWMVFMVVLAHSFVRTDHALFVAIIYALYNFSWHKRSLFENSVLIFTPVLITVLLSRVIFPQAKYYTPLIRIADNITDPWALVYPTVVLILPLIFIKEIRGIVFFRKTWFWIVVFVALNFVVALMREIRLLLPVLVYISPAFLMGVKRVYNIPDK